MILPYDQHYRLLFILLFSLLTQLANCQQRSAVGNSIYKDLYDSLSQVKYDNWWHPVTPSDNPYVIKIETQQDFDKTENLINQALREGQRDIKVVFGKGPFYFKGLHIVLRGDSYPDANIRFVGNNTVLIPTGKHYNKGSVYDGTFSTSNVYLDSKRRDLNIWGQMYHSDEMVEVLDVDSKLCRIHCPDFNLPSEAVSDETYLQLTEWYLAGTYKVTKVEGNYVYFIASDLAPGLSAYGNYNVNYDYTIVKVLPRFRVCNLNDPTAAINLHKGKPAERDFYECEGYTFLQLYGAVYNSFDITGFKFYGNAGKGMLLDFRAAKVARGIHVHGCEFRNIKSVGIYMMQTSNVAVTDCHFEDCYTDVVLAIDKVKNTIVTDNYFHNVGKGLRSCFAIRCQSANFYVARNTIVDFGLGGIGVGKGVSEGFEPGSGIVEDNLLYFTDEYHDWCASNSLIDGGAIYLLTRHDGTTIRFNRIHNYVGAHSNRGIYCDDGAYSFSIYGNVITRIRNSYYIDSRLNSIDGLPTNTNNIVMYNILEGGYKFEGSARINNGCVKGRNIVLLKKGDTPYKNIINNIMHPEKDMLLEYKGNNELMIIIPRSTRKELCIIPFYKKIKHYLKVK